MPHFAWSALALSRRPVGFRKVTSRTHLPHPRNPFPFIGPSRARRRDPLPPAQRSSLECGRKPNSTRGSGRTQVGVRQALFVTAPLLGLTGLPSSSEPGRRYLLHAGHAATARGAASSLHWMRATASPSLGRRLPSATFRKPKRLGEKVGAPFRVRPLDNPAWTRYRMP